MKTSTLIFLIIPIVCGIYFDAFKTKLLVEDGQNLACENMTAYYNGTFQNTENRALTFDAQLQITAHINFNNKRVYFRVNNFNKDYSKEGYLFYVSADKGRYLCNGTINNTCSIPFNDMSYFRVEFWPYGTRYSPDLIYIYPMNKRFVLLNLVENCATTVENNDPWDTDTSLYRNCFCCSDKYDPDPSLGCPISPWNSLV